MLTYLLATWKNAELSNETYELRQWHYLNAGTAIYIADITIWKISHYSSIRIDCMIDNKNLMDTLDSFKSVEDRRLRIDGAILQDMPNGGRKRHFLGGCFIAICSLPYQEKSIHITTISRH